MLKEGPGYACFDQNGVCFHIAKTYDEALRVCAEVRPNADVWYEGPEPWLDNAGREDDTEALAANPQTFAREPDNALRALGLSPMSNTQIEAYSPEKAYKALRPFFPQRNTESHSIEAYDSAEKMADTFLGTTHKLDKPPRPGLPPSYSRGLNLLPAMSLHANEKIEDIAKHAEDVYGIAYRRRHLSVAQSLLKPKSDTRTLCLGSTKQCQACCLVFSGHNTADRYNAMRKLSMTAALLNEPIAFARMLYRAIEKWRKFCECDDVRPFVRLNVYSDIPWELLTPDMFGRFADIQFYDYTKLAGRMPRGPDNKFPVPNYDLTFSYAGTAKNLARMDYEIRENRRRVAVTFATLGYSELVARGQLIPRELPYPGKKRTPYEAVEWKTRPEIGLPREFMGLPVLDGDQSDFRPYDAPNAEDDRSVVVGLRWKIPKSQDVTAAQAREFIVPGYLTETGAFVIEELPRYTEHFDGETPPWLGIDYSKYAAKI